MKKPTWLTRELLMAIHDRQLAEHGGMPGVRDEAALSSAIEEPRRRFENEKLSVPRLAAAYTVWLCVGRPFVEGNTRTAAAVCNTFLALNNHTPVPADVEFFTALHRVAAGQWTEADFDRFVRGDIEQPPAGPMTGRETFPHRSSAMVPQYQCPRCGETDAEPGTVQSTGNMYFRPANAKFLTMKTANIELKANACTHCGHVDLVADVKKLAALTARAQPV